MKEKKFTNWVKRHKAKLFVTGGVIVTTVGTVLLIDNWDSIKGLIVKEVKNLPTKSINIKTEVSDETFAGSEPIRKIVDVREHLRKLPYGYHPSVQKVAEAVELGIDLGGNKTMVSAYSRSYVA